MKIFKVTSDNYENQLMIEEVYHELLMEMSTSDFNTHIAIEITEDSFNWYENKDYIMFILEDL